MNKAFKRGNALWIVISIICLLSSGALLYLMLEEKGRRAETEQKLSEVEKAKRKAEIKLDHTQSELSQLKNQAQLLASQVEQEKKNYQAALVEVDKRDTQLQQLQNDVANEKKQRTSLADSLAQLRESYDDLEEQLEQAKLKVAELKDKASTGKVEQTAANTTGTGVELRKIVVKPQKSLSGKILVVNREFHFVVIDLGRKDGVGIGDEFVIYQGSEEIGRARVEKLYDAMSTAAILAGSAEHQISEYSIVKFF